MRVAVRLREFGWQGPAIAEALRVDPKTIWNWFGVINRKQRTIRPLYANGAAGYAHKPDAPTTKESIAMRGVRYEDQPGIKTGTPMDCTRYRQSHTSNIGCAAALCLEA